MNRTQLSSLIALTTMMTSVLPVRAEYEPWIDRDVLATDYRAYCSDIVASNTFKDDGKVVPIEAVSPTIFGTKITEVSGREKAKKNIAPFGTLFGSVVGAIDGDLKTEYQASKGGVAIGILAGLASPKKVRIVSIPQGSIHVLTLQKPIDLLRNN